MLGRVRIGFAAVCVSVLSVLPASAEKVSIPFVRYESNEKYVSTGAQWGWTTNFQSAAAEEGGKFSQAGLLSGELLLPKGTGPFPVVILMHGCGGLDVTARKWADIWTKHLAKSRIGTLVLDSFSTRGVKSTCGAPDAHWSRRRVDDAYSALDWLTARPDVRTDQVFVMGRSNGGRAVLNALQSIYSTMRKNRFAGGLSLYPHCLARKDDYFYAPILLLAAELDDANPSALCRELGDKKRPANHPELTVKIYPQVRHGFDDGSPHRTFNGWRLGGDPTAAADARLQASEFLARRGALTP